MSATALSRRAVSVWWLRFAPARPVYNSAEGALTGNIFISYRREDSAAYAGRLCDHLGTVFGSDRVFMDAEDITPGQVFTDAIQRTLADCKAVLVVIGPRWRQILKERSGTAQPDYVRLEVEAALQRKVRIVPVLVGGATLDQLADLPAPLAALQFHQAAELRDSSFKEDCARLAHTLGESRRTISRKLLAGAGALILVIALAAVAWTARRDRPQRDPVVSSLLATARSQASRGEQESAYRTLQKALASNPADAEVLDEQTDAAMGWLRDFHVLVPEGGKAEDLAGPSLAELIATLDSALARTARPSNRAADILAHLGWAHWLNQKLASREFGTAPERDLGQALQMETSNVYARAMLGNLLLQRNGSLEEALKHFEIAVRTGKERPFVRRMQLGALVYGDDPAVRRALIQAVNEMRTGGEPLDDTYKRRIRTAYSPTVNDRAALKSTLSALSPTDAWATFLWLTEPPPPGTDPETHQIQRDYSQATLLEISGRKAEALEAFSKLKTTLQARGYTGRILSHVSEATRSLQQ